MIRKRQRRQLSPEAQERLHVAVEAVLTGFEEETRSTEIPRAELKKLLRLYGPAAVSRDLLRRLDDWSDEPHAAVLWALGEMPRDLIVMKLRTYVSLQSKPLPGRLAAQAALQTLGEEVHPSELFPTPREVQPEELDTVRSLMEDSIDHLVESVHQAASSDEAQQVVFSMNDLREASMDFDGLVEQMVDTAYRRGDVAAADFLAVLAQAIDSPAGRQAADRALRKLRMKGIEPSDRLGRGIVEERFYRGVRTLGDPFQQRIALAWERGDDQVQAFIFTLDLRGLGGAITQFTPTRNISRQEFQQNYVEAWRSQGYDLEELDLDAARQSLRAALDANKRHRYRPPAAWQKYGHLVRRSLFPEEK